jgi:rubredoxin
MDCKHYSVSRWINEDNSPADKWTCNVCQAEFYHLEGLSSGKITVMEPHATLRDQFAMAALTGLLADPDMKDCVKCSYIFADAMMEARNNQDGGKGFDAAVDRVIARVDKHL